MWLRLLVWLRGRGCAHLVVSLSFILGAFGLLNFFSVCFGLPGFPALGLASFVFCINFGLLTETLVFRFGFVGQHATRRIASVFVGGFTTDSFRFGCLFVLGSLTRSLWVLVNFFFLLTGDPWTSYLRGLVWGGVTWRSLTFFCSRFEVQHVPRRIDTCFSFGLRFPATTTCWL